MTVMEFFLYISIFILGYRIKVLEEKVTELEHKNEAIRVDSV